MKRILIALVVWLGLGTGASASEGENCLMTNPQQCAEHGTITLPVGPYHGDGLIFVEPPCYKQMEAAMRAMDEFVGPDPSLTSTVYVPPSVRLRAEADRLDRLDKARELWEAVKKTCWTKP